MCHRILSYGIRLGLVWAVVYVVTFAQTYLVHAKAALQKGVQPTNEKQLDTVLFSLILANMFHCCIPKIKSINIATMYISLIDTHLAVLCRSVSVDLDFEL